MHDENKFRQIIDLMKNANQGDLDRITIEINQLETAKQKAADAVQSKIDELSELRDLVAKAAGLAVHKPKKQKGGWSRENKRGERSRMIVELLKGKPALRAAHIAKELNINPSAIANVLQSNPVFKRDDSGFWYYDEVETMQKEPQLAATA